MAHSQDSRRLEETARTVARKTHGNAGAIRDAVRDLALTALRTRLLTATSLHCVAHAIGQGIAHPNDERPAMRRVVDRAFEGLLQAMCQGLLALEISAREYAHGGGRLREEDVEEIHAAVAAIEKLVAGKGWPHARVEQSEFRLRIEGLQRQVGAIETAGSTEGNRVLGLLATGALMGLMESARAARIAAPHFDLTPS